MARRYTPRESRLIAEWANENVLQHPFTLRQPLGGFPAGRFGNHGGADFMRAARPWRFEVDLAVFPPGELWLVEAKIRNITDGLGQLVVYDNVIAETPELEHLVDAPRRLILVSPWELTQFESLAGRLGIELVQFRPAWITAYVEELSLSTTAAATEKRQARRELAVKLGLEDA